MVEPGLRVTVLGPLDVSRNTESVGLGVSLVKPRLLFATLAANANHVLSKETLVDRLWELPPASARNLIEKYVSLWRKVLDESRLETVAAGYRLNLAAEECDLLIAERAVHTAVSAARRGEPGVAARGYTTAIEQWDLNFGSDVAPNQFAALDRSRLIELWLATLDGWATAILSGNRDPAAVIHRLSRALETQPLHERLSELLIWALYKCGRQGEAIAHFDTTRRLLISELGQDPGEGLALMHLRVLQQDPGLVAVERSPAAIAQLPPRNVRFVGRSGELEHVERMYLGGQRVVALSGLIGGGKSALATEYAHLVRNRYDCVWWVDASTRTSTAASLENLAAHLDAPLPVEREPNLSTLWRALPKRTLLIFDDAASPADISPYLPPEPCDVLITSLSPHWRGVGEPVNIDVLNEDDAIALLRSRMGTVGDGREDVLAEALGHLPLAIVQAAAYIDQTGMSVEQYLPLWQRRRNQLLRRGAPDDHARSLDATWRLALAELSASQPETVQLLSLCASLATARIPLELVRRAPDLPIELRTAIAGEVDLEDAIAQARRYSLITRSGDDLVMHPLIGVVIAGSLTVEERLAWRDRAASAIVAAAPLTVEDRADWARWESLVPHATTVAAGYLGGDTVRPGFVEVLRRAGRYLTMRGESSGALAAARQVHAVTVHSADRAATEAEVITELAEALDRAGFPAESMVTFESALQLLATNSPDDPWVARAASGLGNVITCHSGVSLWTPDQLDEAEGRYVRALEILEGTLGPDSAIVARGISGLGQVRQDRCDLTGARDCQQRALDIMIRVYGPSHPDIGHAYDKLGYVLALLGDESGSRACYRSALEQLRKFYGGTHPYVGWSLSNVAMLLLTVGELEEALDDQQQADRIFAAASDKTAQLISTWRLARIHAARGDGQRAVDLLVPTMATARSVLGDRHGDVVAMAADLAAIQSAHLLLSPGRAS